MLSKIKVYACYTVKIYTTPLPQFFFQTRERAPGAPVMDPPLVLGVVSLQDRVKILHKRRCRSY